MSKHSASSKVRNTRHLLQEEAKSSPRNHFQPEAAGMLVEVDCLAPHKSRLVWKQGASAAGL
jgi:hypothetical protein